MKPSRNWMNKTDKDVFKVMRKTAFWVVVLCVVVFLASPVAQMVVILWGG